LDKTKRRWLRTKTNRSGRKKKNDEVAICDTVCVPSTV